MASERKQFPRRVVVCVGVPTDNAFCGFTMCDDEGVLVRTELPEELIVPDCPYYRMVLERMPLRWRNGKPS